MPLRVHLEQETDGRWIAEVDAVPGALAYGATADEATQAVKSLVLRVFADRLDHGEDPLTGHASEAQQFLDDLFEVDAA
jgi:predicted RNase H-like HicB family nuclease